MFYFQAIAGLVAGLAAGVVTGVMYLIMQVPQFDVPVPVLSVIARAVSSTDAAVGWSFHLFNSVVTGILFGVIFGKNIRNLTEALAAGLAAGLVCWGVGTLWLLPALQGLAPLSPLFVSRMHPFAIAMLIGSIVYGILLGVVFLWIYRPVQLQEYGLMRQNVRQRRRETELSGAVRRNSNSSSP